MSNLSTLDLGSSSSLSSSLSSSIDSLRSLSGYVNTYVVVFTLFLGLLILDQVRYQVQKSFLPGPKYREPIIGAFLQSLNPTFENYLASWESGPLSCVSVFHKFIVIAANGELSRKILNSPRYTEPCLVYSAKQILKHDNWVFLDGKEHVEYRKGLNVLFTRKALGAYLPNQHEVYLDCYKAWLEASKNGPVPFMTLFRDLSLLTSCRVFCGKYITDEEMKVISNGYWRLTAALELVNFPLPLPGTKVWHAIQCRKYIVNIFEKCAQMARDNMAEGKEVTCMIDAWLKEMLEAKAFVSKVGQKNDAQAPILVRDFSNHEIALVFLSFLFASQDATTSGSTWTFQLLADHPEVLEKVREEQLRVRGGDIHKPVDIDMAESMHYTRMVIKESLRVKPPVLMIPYLAKKAFPITPEYTVPKGAMIIPTFWNSLHDPEAYPEPDKFDPERWGPNGTADKHPTNWLAFGTGRHVCIGQQYAMMHMMVSTGLAALLMDWKHTVTEKSEKIKIFSTIYPQDDCILEFTSRI